MKSLPQNVINLVKNNKMIYSGHFKDRQKERKLLNVDLKKALVKGEVIEYLYRFNVGEKFLVYCKINDLVFHIVVILKHNKLLLKTIYIPNSEKFESDNKTRKEKKI